MAIHSILTLLILSGRPETRADFCIDPQIDGPGFLESGACCWVIVA